MRQELYSYLKHKASATKTLFFTPIEVIAGVMTKCKTFRNATFTFKSN